MPKSIGKSNPAYRRAAASSSGRRVSVSCSSLAIILARCKWVTSVGRQVLIKDYSAQRSRNFGRLFRLRRKSRPFIDFHAGYFFLPHPPRTEPMRHWRYLLPVCSVPCKLMFDEPVRQFTAACRLQFLMWCRRISSLHSALLARTPMGVCTLVWASVVVLNGYFKAAASSRSASRRRLFVKQQ